MAELTEELTRDLSKIFENAVFRGLTDGAKKALKDQAFKQAEQLIGSGVRPEAVGHAVASSAFRAARGIGRLGFAGIRDTNVQLGLAGIRDTEVGVGSPTNFDRPQQSSIDKVLGARVGAPPVPARISDSVLQYRPWVNGRGPPLQIPYLPDVSNRPLAAPDIPWLGPSQPWQPQRSGSLSLSFAAPSTLGNNRTGATAAGPPAVPGFGPLSQDSVVTLGGRLQAAHAAGRGSILNQDSVQTLTGMTLSGLDGRQEPASWGGGGDWSWGGSGGGGGGGGRPGGPAPGGAGRRGYLARGVASLLGPGRVVGAVVGAAVLEPLWTSMDSAAGMDRGLASAARRLGGDFFRAPGHAAQMTEEVFAETGTRTSGVSRDRRGDSAWVLTQPARPPRDVRTGEWGRALASMRKGGDYEAYSEFGFSKEEFQSLVGVAAQHPGGLAGGLWEAAALSRQIGDEATAGWNRARSLGSLRRSNLGALSFAQIFGQVRGLGGFEDYAMSAVTALGGASIAAGGGGVSATRIAGQLQSLGQQGFAPEVATHLASSAWMAGQTASKTSQGPAQEDLWRLAIAGGLDLTKGYVSPQDLWGAQLRAARNPPTAQQIAGRALRMASGLADPSQQMRTGHALAGLAGLDVTADVFHDLITGKAGPSTQAASDRVREVMPAPRATGSMEDAARSEAADARSAYAAAGLSGDVRTALSSIKESLSRVYTGIERIVEAIPR